MDEKIAASPIRPAAAWPRRAWPSPRPAPGLNQFHPARLGRPPPRVRSRVESSALGHDRQSQRRRSGQRVIVHKGLGVPPHRSVVLLCRRGPMKLHDLRHFYTSGLIAEGCDVVTVQRALGHRSATVTLNTYAHLWPTAEDRTRKAAAVMLATTLRTADSERTRRKA